jgi:polyhydroxyalkanoate synthesis regulator phasin
MAISDTVRRYVEAGREALSPGKAEELARALAKQGEIRRDQVSGLARDLVDWSRRNRERLLDIIRREVNRQISRAGVATKDDVDSLKRRVRDLERGARKGAGGTSRARARTTSRTAGATRTRAASTRSTGGTAKKTTRSTRPRKKTTAKRTTA